MKVYCPISECTWETTFPTKGLDNHQIFAKGKSELNNHKRKSKHCNRCYCACSKSFTTQHGLDCHIRQNRNKTDEHGPAYAVANAPFGDEGNAEDIKDFIIVEDMKDWGKMFINRENIESFGPTQA